MKKVSEILKRGLIVSCQAREGEPTDSPVILAAMAKSALMGGAVGIRANGPENVSEIKKNLSLPIIGIYKQNHPDCEVYITPTFEAAKEVVEAGSDIIAVDATERSRPGDFKAPELIKKIRSELDIPVMADISTLEEGVKAEEWGADIIATTLAGYTDYTKSIECADLELLKRLVESVKVPVIAEGRYNTPELAAEAIRIGAYGVVVGTAITRPNWITEQFVRKVEESIG